jgi:hypothetical protein
MMPVAAEVATAFLRAYAAGRACFPDDEWRHVWTSTTPRYWAEFLFAPGRPAFRDAYAPQARSVLRETAAALELEYVAGRPAGVAAALAPRGFRTAGGVPLPLLVAVEEKGNVTTFDEEIARLTHVRAPIKLGITYVNWARERFDSDDEMEDAQERRRETYQARITASFEKIGELASEYTLEDARTEYAVLLGVEKARYSYEWYRLVFDAAHGPGRGRWKRG